MSDARQAIRAASAAGANARNSDAMSAAEALVNQAEQALESRRYRDARRLAMEAKVRAISARTVVQQEATFPVPAGVDRDLW